MQVGQGAVLVVVEDLALVERVRGSGVLPEPYPRMHATPANKQDRRQVPSNHSESLLVCLRFISTFHTGLTVLGTILTSGLAFSFQCEGNKPDPCKRCRDRRLHCVYEPHTKTAKDDLLRSLEDTRAKNTELQNQNKDIAAHAKGLEEANRDLQQTSDWQRIILETIGSNGHDREIIKKLRGGESHQVIADWLVAENPDYQSFALEPATHRTLTEVVKIYEAQCQQYDGLPRVGGPSESRIPWTKVSVDHTLLGHLFDLYFTWVHPVHMLLSELDFKHDFKHNNGTHCSSSLVNVICAMACLLLEGEKEASKFTDLRRGLNAAALRDGFMEEAKKALAEQPFESLTSIQTLAVMYLVDLSAGKSRSATGYLRSASEGLRAKKGYQQTEEAIEVTIWGIRNLIMYAG